MLTEIAKALYAWNDENLVASADFKKSDIKKFFANKFTAIANGRRYDANQDNYFDFLNEFRLTIKSLKHEVYEYIEADNAVTMPSIATVIRTDGSKQIFEVFLLLKFNEDKKVILWHELYIERK